MAAKNLFLLLLSISALAGLQCTGRTGMEHQDTSPAAKRPLLKGSKIDTIELYCWCLRLDGVLKDSSGINLSTCTTPADIEYSSILGSGNLRFSTNNTNVLETFRNEFNNIDSLDYREDKPVINARLAILIKYEDGDVDTLIRNASGGLIFNSRYIVTSSKFSEKIRKVFPTIDEACK